MRKTYLVRFLIFLAVGILVCSFAARHTLASSLNGTSPGRVFAWGLNSRQQIGMDSSVPFSSSPVGFAPTPTASLSSGAAHTLGIIQPGYFRVVAWGDNSFGQLGDGTTTPSATPVNVNLPPQVTIRNVAAGGRHSLALAYPTGQPSSQIVFAWGDNSSGQLGTDGVNISANPLGVPLPAEFAQLPDLGNNSIAAGDAFSLALGPSGTVYGWGDNSAGQLGDGTTTSRSTPQPVIFPNLLANERVNSIAAGGRFALAVTSMGNLYAWGDNSSGQLGTGIRGGFSATPVKVALPTGAYAIWVAAGATDAFADWAYPPLYAPNATFITAPQYLYAWGDNTYGQLGDGTTTVRPTPVPVALPPGATVYAIGAGATHTVVSGYTTIYAWGDNTWGQLGDGTQTPHLIPEAVPSPYLEPVMDLSAGYGFTVATAEPVPSSFSVVAAPNPAPVGSPVTLNAFVTSSDPTLSSSGWVYFSINGSPLCGSLNYIGDFEAGQPLGRSCTFTATGPGTVTAEVFLFGALSPAHLYASTYLNVLQLSATSISLLSNNPQPYYGQPLTFSAIVQGPSSLPPPTFEIGSLQFLQNGNPLGSPVQAAIATSFPSGTMHLIAAGSPFVDSPYVRGVISPAGSAQYYIQGTQYGGSFQPVASPAYPTGSMELLINDQFGSPVLDGIFSPTGSVTSFNPNSPFLELMQNQPAPSPIPTGAVSFFIDGIAFGAPVALSNTLPISCPSNDPTCIPSSIPVSYGIAGSSSISALTPGTHTVSVAYSGDGNYQPGSQSLAQIVVQAGISGNLSSSLNPSDPGDPITFSVALSGAAPPASCSGAACPPPPPPPGCSPTDPTCAPPPPPPGCSPTDPTCAPPPPSGGGGSGCAATDPTCIPPPGCPATGCSPTAPTAPIAPSSTCLASDPTCGSQPPCATCTPPPPCSGAACPPPSSLPAGPAAPPSGIVIFTVDGNPILPPVPVTNGQATTPPLAGLAPGAHNVWFGYAGDSNYLSFPLPGEFGPPISQFVRIPTSVVASSGTPFVYGQPVSITATVPQSWMSCPLCNTIYPTGTVTFLEGPTVLAVQPLANSQAGVTLPPMSVGTHNITLTYSGDATFTGSTAIASIVVNRAPTAAAITSSADPSILGQSVTFTANVSVPPPGAGTPTGSVAFTDGANLLATLPLPPSGQVTFTTSALPVNAHSIAAAYSGDGNFLPSSNSLTQLVHYEPAGTLCDGSPGHQILQPVAAAGTSVFKQGSTVPAKFRVCDVNGASIGTPGVVSSFFLTTIMTGTSSTAVDDTVLSTTPDAAFRWDPTAEQWVFNIATSNLPAGSTYLYTIGLNDGTSISFQFGLK